MACKRFIERKTRGAAPIFRQDSRPRSAELKKCAPDGRRRQPRAPLALRRSERGRARDDRALARRGAVSARGEGAARGHLGGELLRDHGRRGRGEHRRGGALAAASGRVLRGDLGAHGCADGRGRRGRERGAPVRDPPWPRAEALAPAPPPRRRADARARRAPAARRERVGAVDERPHPPGDYDVVVVGSGPGGLQTGHFLDRLGVRHALISADDEPAGMFRKWPIFERLISWSAVDAPVDSGTREYERYDQNSLISDEPDLRALVPASMGRESLYPTRAEMQAGVVAFAGRAVRVRYGCRWES